MMFQFSGSQKINATLNSTGVPTHRCGGLRLAGAALAASAALGGSACNALKGNVPYRSKEARSSASISPVKPTDSITVTIPKIQLNDRFGNDFERAILVAAGILRNTEGNAPDGVPISTASNALSDSLEKEIDDYFTPERMAEMQAAMPPPGEGVPIAALSNMAAEIKKLVKDKLQQELQASYTLEVTTTATSFTTLARLEDESSFEFSQASIARTFTEAQPNLLLFDGGQINKLAVAMKLERDSVIAQALQNGLEKLSESHWVADVLESALSSVSLGFAADLGRKLGERIDDAIYDEASRRYAPTPQLFSATWRFHLSDSAQLTPTALLEGVTLCTVNASVEGDAPRDVEDSQLFRAEIVVTRRGAP